MQVFFAVLIGAFALGQTGPNVQALLTAAGAAGTVFEIIDRVRMCCACLCIAFSLFLNHVLNTQLE